MKFNAQVASYQNKLRRRSRFFSSLMLVSGLSLAAAAPFLSLEVSKIECNEIGKEDASDDNEALQSLRLELESKDETISQLESKVGDQNDEINNLASNPDCDDIVRRITDERENLVVELREVTTASEAKDETITDLEREVNDKDEEINNLTSNPDCDNLVQVVERDRDRIKTVLKEVTTDSKEKDNTIKRLRESLKACEEKLNQPPDCGEFTGEINRLRKSIKTKDQLITQLRTSLQEAGSCPTMKLTGVFRNQEVFSFNGNRFVISVNSDDVGASYGITHNRVSQKIEYNANNRGSYTFTDRNKKNYLISFGNVSRGTLPYTLTSL